MRKKRHFRVHPENPSYDRFYLVNYTPHTTSSPSSRIDYEPNFNEDEEQESWSDWTSESTFNTPCLFCPLSVSTSDILSHMSTSHSFDLMNISKELNLGFYDRVKVVNYILEKGVFTGSFFPQGEEQCAA